VTGRAARAIEGAEDREAKAKAQEQTERDREKTRRRIAYVLIGTLVIVVLASFVYIIWLSLRSNELTQDALISVIQTIGTTLLAPLVGLIGAVVGFYYGGQTAVQGAQTATQASTQATQAAQSVAQAATELASQMTPEQQQRPPEQERSDT
jgi:flagellar basal body-associated protein FliL